MQILIAIIIFLEIISYLVIFDVVLSWLLLLGIRFRPRFIANIMDPIYSSVKRFVPTIFGPFDFTPIIIILLIIFIKGALYILFPELPLELNNLIN